MSPQIAYSAAIIIAYIIGSIPSAIVISKWMRLPDPRSLGSGNPGATNVLRTGNKMAAVLTLSADIFKGFLPVIVAYWLNFELEIICLVGAAAIIGHMYPIFLRFQGGKGVATTLGVWFGISWLLAVIWMIIWLSIAKIFRYSSLAALLATMLLPVVAWYLNYPQAITVFAIVIGALVIWRHRRNIKNLVTGSESKIGHTN